MKYKLMGKKKNLFNITFSTINIYFILTFLTITYFPGKSAAGQSAFPYSLAFQKDAYISAIALLFYSVGNFSENKIPKTDIYDIDKNDIIKFDRFACEYNSDGAKKISNVTMAIGFYLPVVTTVAKPDLSKKVFYNNCITLGTMYLETVVFTEGLTNLAKGTFRRHRPYFYNDAVPESKKKSAYSQKSMWSGHTSAAFSGAVFSGIVLNKVIPGSKLTRLVWGIGIASSTATAVLRVKAGEHFPSDVAAGAAVGSLTGWLIPYLHKSGGLESPVHISYFNDKIIFNINF